jgi:RNA polymerase sigma-B factor
MSEQPDAPASGLSCQLVDPRHGATRDVDAETAHAWCVEYATAPSAALRERIVAAHQWLVWVCARQLRRRHEPLEDLVQVANIGLLKALDRFDPGFGVAFHTYASATIIGELRRHYRGVWQLHVPRSLQERHLAANAAIEQLVASRGRSPSIGELADHLGLSAAEVSEAVSVGSTTWVGALPEDDSLSPTDASSNAEEHVDDVHLTRALLAMLEPRARAMLVSWVIDGMTQQAIGREFGLSQVQVSRSVRRSLQRLRAVEQQWRAAAAS